MADESDRHEARGMPLLSEPSVPAVRFGESGHRPGRLAAVVADGRPTRARTRPVIVMLGFRAALDDFEVQRLRFLAEVVGALVVGVENPGYGTVDAPMTSDQRRGLRHGDFGPIASEVLDVASVAAPDVVQNPLLVGYSLGASVAAAAARVLAERVPSERCPRIVLVEPVGARRWGPLALANANAAEVKKVDAHLGRNSELGWALPPNHHRPESERWSIYSSARDQVRQVWGLSRGRVVDDLRLARGGGMLRVDLIHGLDSRLADSNRMKSLRRELDGIGCSGSIVELAGAGHALWLALPLVKLAIDEGLELHGSPGAEFVPRLTEVARATDLLRPEGGDSRDPAGPSRPSNEETHRD